MLHFWTNFDEEKFIFIFYDSFYNVMTTSLRSEAEKNISDRLLGMVSNMMSIETIFGQ